MKSHQLVSIPKRVSEALKLKWLNPTVKVKFVSIPKRVSEALKLGMDRIKLFVRIVSIPKRVSEALKHRHSPLSSQKLLFQSLKGFQRL